MTVAFSVNKARTMLHLNQSVDRFLNIIAGWKSILLYDTDNTATVMFGCQQVLKAAFIAHYFVHSIGQQADRHLPKK